MPSYMLVALPHLCECGCGGEVPNHDVAILLEGGPAASAGACLSAYLHQRQWRSLTLPEIGRDFGVATLSGFILPLRVDEFGEAP